MATESDHVDWDAGRTYGSESSGTCEAGGLQGLDYGEFFRKYAPKPKNDFCDIGPCRGNGPEQDYL